MTRIDPLLVSLIVIAKEPLAGRAKTRLGPALGTDGAAALAEACLIDTLEAVATTPASRRVLVLEGEPGDWIPAEAGFEVVSQRPGDLAGSLAGAFADTGGPAFLVGMDTPQVSPEMITIGIETLASEDVDAVLGPADDGGYWSIGLRAPNADVFAGVPMSADDTGAAQLARLEGLGMRTVELEPLRDIDTIEDARAVAAAAPVSNCARVLAELDDADEGER